MHQLIGALIFLFFLASVAYALWIGVIFPAWSWSVEHWLGLTASLAIFVVGMRIFYSLNKIEDSQSVTARVNQSLIALALGFGFLLYWGAVWVFWVVGALIILDSRGKKRTIVVQERVAERRPDRRFKRGFRTDVLQQEVSRSYKEREGSWGEAMVGVLCCVMAYFARDIVAWMQTPVVGPLGWMDSVGWIVMPPVLLVALSYPVISFALAYKGEPRRLVEEPTRLEQPRLAIEAEVDAAAESDISDERKI